MKSKKDILQKIALFCIQLFLLQNLFIFNSYAFCLKRSFDSVSTLSPSLNIQTSSVQIIFDGYLSELRAKDHQEETLNFLKALDEKVFAQVLKEKLPEKANLLAQNTQKHLGEDGFITVINARLYSSFSEISKKLEPLHRKGIRQIYLLGIFEESEVSRKTFQNDKDDDVHNFIYSRDKTGKVISVVKDTSWGGDNLNASSFAIPDFSQPNPKLGGKKEFKQLLQKAKQLNIKILIDLVAHSTSVDSSWLENEEFQKGGHYYYIYKDISAEDQARLQAVDNKRNLPHKNNIKSWETDKGYVQFVELCEQILAKNPGYFLHYSTKLSKWILIANFCDSGMKKQGKFFPDIAQLNLGNPAVYNELIKNVIEYTKIGVSGFRCDCAMAGILHGKDGFFDTWNGHSNNKMEYTMKDFWQELIGSVKNIYPQAIFIAEAYWFFDELERCGFDYIYQIVVGNFIRGNNILGLRDYLMNTPVFEQNGKVHSISNHDDEPFYVAEHQSYPNKVLGRFKRDIVSIATLPGTPTINLEQLEGYLARSTALFLNLDSVDSKKKEVEKEMNVVLELGRDDLFRKGKLYVFSSQDPNIFAFARYDEQERIGLVLSNYYDYGYIIELAFDQPAATLGIKSQKDKYYALIDRFSGNVYLRKGINLINEPFKTVIQAHGTKILMLQELNDHQNVLKNIFNKNYSNGYTKPLAIEDILSLINNFGLKLDFSSEGDIYKAIVINYLSDSFSNKEVMEFLIGNSDINVIKIGQEKESIARQINNFKEKYPNHKGAQNLTRILNYFNQDKIFDNSSLKIYLNVGTGKTEFSAEGGSLYIKLGDYFLKNYGTKETLDDIFQYMKKFYFELPESTDKKMAYSADQISVFIQAAMALFNEEVLDIIINHKCIMQNEVLYASEGLISRHESIYEYIRCKENPISHRRYLANLLIKNTLPRLDEIGLFQDLDRFVDFLLKYLIAYQKINELEHLIESAARKYKNNILHDLLFAELLIDYALVRKNPAIDIILINFLNQEDNNKENVLEFKKYVYQAIGENNRTDLLIRIGITQVGRKLKFEKLNDKYRPITQSI
ncbi:MAG: alpha-amylase family glycosyl hydrolase [Candidatus Omnitrophota bacterium]